jgi:gliding motility-associated-like protein
VKFNNTSVCEPGSAFTWQFGDGSGSFDRSPSHIYTEPGDFNTTLLVISPFGCIDSTGQTITLTQIPPPEAIFAQSHRIVSIFDAEVSFTNQSLNATRYRWSFDDGESSDAENPTHLFDKVGTQKVILTAFNGANCFDEYISTVEVAPFFVPTAFSPNDDGKNDVFFDGTPAINVRSYRMDVLNRWGENIYTTDSYLRPWDGLDRSGEPVPAGLYVYRIRINSLKGKDYEFTGTFSVIR